MIEVNYLENITCQVNNKLFEGGAFDNKTLSGIFNGQFRSTKIKNVIEAFNFLIDNCDINNKENILISFGTQIPTWALQPIDIEDDYDEDEYHTFDNIIIKIKNDKTFTIMYDFSYKKYRSCKTPYKLRTKDDIKKYMECIFTNKKPSPIKTKQEDYFN